MSENSYVKDDPRRQALETIAYHLGLAAYTVADSARMEWGGGGYIINYSEDEVNALCAAAYIVYCFALNADGRNNDLIERNAMKFAPKLAQVEWQTPPMMRPAPKPCIDRPVPMD